MTRFKSSNTFKGFTAFLCPFFFFGQSIPGKNDTTVTFSEKDESTLAAEQLAHAHSLGPKVIIMDFKHAQFRAFEATFNGEVQGFFFYFRKALIKNLKSKNELFEKYLNDDKGKCCFAITWFAALAFVQTENTGIGFEALLKDAYIKKHSTIFKGYLDYFEQQ
ncbi:hypothetical protein DSO57_1011641 [Entomophthora muscae]|uniref:Uncharacterized protein n=1 Tax=Entomophthora muscae TaxID=34485 RepID=A0ACC2RL33_9FUNG|nr:hypothetical protein DSO57_1011641 [Entomophthora muscae]